MKWHSYVTGLGQSAKPGPIANMPLLTRSEINVKKSLVLNLDYFKLNEVAWQKFLDFYYADFQILYKDNRVMEVKNLIDKLTP